MALLLLFEVPSAPYDDDEEAAAHAKHASGKCPVNLLPSNLSTSSALSSDIASGSGPLKRLA
jgi:hypothetical protein